MYLPFNKNMLLKTIFIWLFWSRRGTTMKDTYNSTISPFSNVCGPVLLKLPSWVYTKLIQDFRRVLLPCPCIILAHFKVVNFVFLGMNVSVALLATSLRYPFGSISKVIAHPSFWFISDLRVKYRLEASMAVKPSWCEIPASSWIWGPIALLKRACILAMLAVRFSKLLFP